MLSARTGWARQILSWANVRSEEPPIIDLDSEEVRALRRNGRTLRVLEGTAWLTMAGRDHILEPGQSVILERGPEEALLSALDSPRVSVQVG